MEFNVIKTVVAIYPGRFQPFGKHHADTFKWLQSKFGAKDTFIATSDNVKLPNSPLNFKEKQAIISKYGFGNNLIQVKNPYKAEEITAKYDPKTTAVVFMVGKKDMQEDPRFVIGKKKDGTDSYFQKYDPDKPMKSYLQHGYLIVAPHKSYNIPGIGEMSGTNIRAALSSPTTAAQYKKNFEGIFGWWDEKLARLMKQKFSNQPLKETTILSSLFKALLMEGGNVFKDENGKEATKRINRADVIPTVKYLEKITALNLVDNMLGTTGRKDTSGDLDLGVNEKEISKDELVSLLLNKFSKNDIKKSGNNVHLKTPINGNPKNGFVQTDFMFGDQDWLKFSMQGGRENSTFKGVDRALLMASIAKAQGLKWSYLNGLVDRETNKTLTKNPDEIAKLLLSKNATGKDLADVESIIDIIKNRKDYKDLIAQAQSDFEKKGLTLNEGLLKEGGAGGHMAHPFDLDKVKTGNDLVRIFEQTAKFLTKNPAPVKIDGVNAAIRLGNIDGKREFVLDRGSSKEIDIKGITKADLPARFTTPGHGMIKIGGKVLDIFNTAYPVIKGDLAKLGMIKNPNILLNIEYVEGKTNVQEYGKNFLAIHNLIEISQNPGKQSRSTHEIPYSKDVLEDMIKKLQPIAKKYGFEVLSSIPAKIEKTPNFAAALSKNYTVVVDKNNKQTKSLKAWLNEAKNTKGLRIKLKDGKTVDALSKQVFLAIKNGTPITELIANPKDQKTAIDSFVIYEATMELGDALLKSMTSPLGPVDQQEGIVVRDPAIDSDPFKITGSFIVRGLQTSFTR